MHLSSTENAYLLQIWVSQSILVSRGESGRPPLTLTSLAGNCPDTLDLHFFPNPDHGGRSWKILMPWAGVLGWQHPGMLGPYLSGIRQRSQPMSNSVPFPHHRGPRRDTEGASWKRMFYALHELNCNELNSELKLRTAYGMTGSSANEIIRWLIICLGHYHARRISGFKWKEFLNTCGKKGIVSKSLEVMTCDKVWN